MSDEQIETKKCIACATEIPAAATLCGNCSSYQSKSKNSFKYFASILGIAGALVAVVAYTVSVVPEIRRVLAWREGVQVLGYDNRTYTIVNEGDGELYLSHFYIQYWETRNARTRHTYLEPIERIIRPGEILTSGSVHWRDGAEDMSVVSGISDEEWTGLFRDGRTTTEDACIMRRFLSESDRLLNMWQSVLKDNLKKFPVEAELHYYSPRSRSNVIVPFDAVGVLLMYKNRDCAS